MQRMQRLCKQARQAQCEQCERACNENVSVVRFASQAICYDSQLITGAYDNALSMVLVLAHDNGHSVVPSARRHGMSNTSNLDPGDRKQGPCIADN